MSSDLMVWLPGGHPAYNANDLVDGLDLSVLHPVGSRRSKNASYKPRMVAKLLIYGYSTGMFSSRRMVKKAQAQAGLRCSTPTGGKSPLITSAAWRTASSWTWGSPSTSLFWNRQGYPHLTELKRVNQRLLVDVIQVYGFVPYEAECWHFTLRNELYPETYFGFPEW